MSDRKLKYFWAICSVAVIFAGGLVAGIFLNRKWHKHFAYSERQEFYNKSEHWEFINPLLDCGEINNASNSSIQNLEKNIKDLVLIGKNKGDIIDASVYFRDLNNGPWFGVNEKELFAPASLLKVPLMMTVYIEAEHDPAFLKKKFKYKGGSNNKEYFAARNELVKDSDYSVAEALEYLIRYSDNNAYYVLYNVMSSTLRNTYNFLGMMSQDETNFKISAQTYASFFRVLYNSTFLNREYSEQALKLLSQTEFDRGIVAGVPNSVVVSHKFGERQTATQEKYLHDCGIIYKEGTPYMLCVMTKGSDFEKMANFIRDISKKIYQEV